MFDTTMSKTHESSIESSMQSILERQLKAHSSSGPVSLEIRLDRLDRVIALLQKYNSKFCAAIADDFGHRSIAESKMTDIGGSLTSLRDARKRLPSWMRSEKRSSMFPLGFFGARSRVDYQPLGVIGCISPWNFPLQLCFGPLAGILAAGNRSMIKPSELTPATAELMKVTLTEYFDIEEIAVITGDSEVGSAFSRLNFDHLIFTGGKSVAKQIIRATSENMVPLTLELGGKSPVIIGKSADLDSSTAKIMMGKTLNAGQICLAPDYVFVHEDSVKDFICSAKTSVSSMFPSLKENPDYTSMINSHHFERIKEYIEDARQKGAEIVEINPIDENFEGQRHFRIPPTLIVEPTDDMKIMQHEVFGPVLSIKKYSTIDEPLNYINAHPSPLALYYFGQDKREQKYVLEHSTSGGVTINDVLLHAAQDDLPFGGVGSSGYGRYHGYEGFKQFSNARSIFTQSKIVSKLAATMWPPHT